MITGCSNCKEKKETRKVHSFRLCEKCFVEANKGIQKAYPVWPVGKPKEQ